MRDIVTSIEGEYRRYKQLGDKTFAQVPDEQLLSVIAPGANSIAAIVWHISGNLASRFTDFLTSDGEKPWRDRESEFASRHVSRAELLEKWEHGWVILFGALAPLGDDDLRRTVTIRGVGLSVMDALTRSLAHASYHVGQIVFLGKTMRADGWQSLSIPPGMSAAYNQKPDREKP